MLSLYVSRMTIIDLGVVFNKYFNLKARLYNAGDIHEDEE